MRTPASPPSTDLKAHAWAEVAEHLEAFAGAWGNSPEPPVAAHFLPVGPSDVRQMVLIEIVKFDIDCRLRQSIPWRIEDYVQAYPELDTGSGPPCALLYEDFQLRQQAGYFADSTDYFLRFPRRASELACLLGISSPAPAFAAQNLTEFVPGTRLDEFDLLALLGEGQFAKVFLARQTSMQRLVALKVSALRGAEAQTLARLDHTNIVRVYDQRALTALGVLLVYMPYLAGGTLLDVVQRARAVPPAQRTGRTLLEAVDASLERRGEHPSDSASRRHWAEQTWPATVCAIGAKLAWALDYAHRRGVLHRDVKPANVLLTAEGEPLLADFNIGSCAKLDEAGPIALFGGSLAYMAPEHLEAFDPDHPRHPDSLDGRADVYSLAVTLWELLTGMRPTSDAHTELIDGDVPGLKAVLLYSLAPDRADRPATAGEMAAELELCLRPETRALVRPAAGGWREIVRRHPLLAIYPPALAVNSLASLFNIVYNYSEIVVHWQNADAPFQLIVPLVNGVLFPVAMLVIAVIMLPVVRGLSRMRRGESTTPAELARLRLRTLRLGETTAGVCVAFWLIAGVVWPIALRLAAGPSPGGFGTYAHFMLSLAVCGLVAAAYPYFLVNFLAVRVFYPTLLGPDGPAPTDGPALQRVERELGRYRAAAAAVPLLAVTLLASQATLSLYAAAALGIAGLAGVALAYVIEWRTRADLTALAQFPVMGSWAEASN